MTLFDRVVGAARAFLAPEVRSAPVVRDAREEKRSPADLTSHNLETPTQDKWSTIFGAKLTPARVAVVLREAEQGRMRAQCELLSEMRESASQVQSELGKREGSVAGVGWSIVAASTKGMGKRAEKRALEIRDFVETVFQGIPDFQDALEHLAGGAYYGRSAVATTFGRNARGITIESLDSIYPQRLSYAANNWRIHLYDESGNDVNPLLGVYPGVDIRREWPGRFVIHEPRTLGAMVKTRQGLGRVLVWVAMFLKWTDRDWMVFAELFAKPWRIGFYSKNSDVKDITTLKQGLLALSGYASAVFAEGTKPEFFWPQGVGNSKIHLDLHRAWITEISKVINGATLQSDASSSGGSRAQAEVHERTEYKLITKDGNALESTIRKDLIFWLVLKQFGPNDAHELLPLFKLHTEAPENLDNTFGRVTAFVDRGGQVDEDEVRQKFLGLSKPKPNAKMLKPLGGQSTDVANDNTPNQSTEKPSSDTPGSDKDE